MTMPGTIQIIASIAGVNISTTLTDTATGADGQSVALNIAEAGTLTTRTDDNDGEITATDADHEIDTGDVIDIYFTAGVAYGATVGTVAGTAIPFTGASGTALPTQDDAVIGSVVKVLDVDIDGDLIQMLVANVAARWHIVFEDVADAVLDAQALAANVPYFYIAGAGMTNPLTGNAIDEVHISSADLTTAQTFKMGTLYDSS